MQSDKKPPANKLAMSRALGAAFLSHQVEQLEKSVGKESRGATSNNWRERTGQAAAGRGAKRGGGHPHQVGRKRERKDGERNESKEPGKTRERREHTGAREEEKDADTVVVDASVLVHALGQVKKWCRDGRQEEIVIPLEALNTLDLFKKGSTPLAQRARAASRILEAQVGTNPRIRVQRDDAFVLWDDVPFSTPTHTSNDFPSPSDAKPESARPGNIPAGLSPPPEWLRRTICCGSWEVTNAAAPIPSSSLALPTVPPHPRSSPTSSIALSSNSANVEPQVRSFSGNNNKPPPSDRTTPKKVVLAVLAPPPSGDSPSNSLEASTFNPGRYERADGSLVRLWAQRAGIQILDIEPTPTPGPGPPASPLPPHHAHASPEKRRPLGMERRDRDHKDGERERKPSLVEKPIAMTIVNDQPVKVLRVLARGEKLEP